MEDRFSLRAIIKIIDKSQEYIRDRVFYSSIRSWVGEESRRATSVYS